MSSDTNRAVQTILGSPEKIPVAPTPLAGTQPDVRSAPSDGRRAEHDPTFLENIKSTRDLRHAAYVSFDKSIQTLSAGAIFLTVTFLEKLVPHPDTARFLWALYGSWIALAVSLVAITASQLTSAKSLTIQADNLIAAEYNKPAKPNRWEKPTSRLNFAAIITFGFGVAFFIFFGITNVTPRTESATMSNEVKKSMDSNIAIPSPKSDVQPNNTTTSLPSNTTIPAPPPPAKDKK